MVALEILVLSVRVRIPISQLNQLCIKIGYFSVIYFIVTHGRNIMGNYFYFV